MNKLVPTALAAVLGLGMVAVPAIAAPKAKDVVPDKKVAVCKYVSKPNTTERLKDGKQPIVVSVNAIGEANPKVGDHFKDGQELSVVVAVAGDKIPDASVCAPTPDKPATTPTDKPSTKPSDKPSTKPSDKPSTKPSDKPSTKPSDKPGKPGDTTTPNKPTKPSRGVDAKTGVE